MTPINIPTLEQVELGAEHFPEAPWYTIICDPMADVCHTLANMPMNSIAVECQQCGNVWDTTELIPRCKVCGARKTKGTGK
jgi:rubrerythrin